MAVQIRGLEIAAIRGALGLSAAQFAQVLGVHPSSVHRWEAVGKESVTVDGVAANLLVALAQDIKKRRDAAKVGEAIGQALMIGGTLIALGVLVNWLTDGKR